jgi:uncharacterized cupredoxin-like copper-binding protein
MTTTINQLPPESSPADPGPLTTAPTWADLQALEDRLEQKAVRDNTWTLLFWASAAFALVLSVIGVGLGSRAITDSKRHASAASAPTTPAASVPAPAVSPVAVALTEFHVRAASTIAAGNVTLQIANGGTVPHELLVFRSALAPSAYPMKDGNIDEEGPGITKVSDGDNLAPGASQTRSVDLSQPGTYLFVCNLPGHFAAGMFNVITVK